MSGSPSGSTTTTALALPTAAASWRIQASYCTPSAGAAENFPQASRFGRL